MERQRIKRRQRLSAERVASLRRRFFEKQQFFRYEYYINKERENVGIYNNDFQAWLDFLVPSVQLQPPPKAVRPPGPYPILYTRSYPRSWTRSRRNRDRSSRYNDWQYRISLWERNQNAPYQQYLRDTADWEENIKPIWDKLSEDKQQRLLEIRDNNLPEGYFYKEGFENNGVFKSF